MRVLLYRSKGIISSLIRWQTRSPYAHVALLFDDETIIEAHWKPGVYSRKLDQSDDLPNVDWFKVETTPEQEQAIRHWAESTLGCRYDTLAILRFISRRKMTDNNRWFCSEHVFEAFRKAGIRLLERTEAWEVSPGLLVRSPLMRRL
jgi:uncharacterized protein YycO